MTENKKQEARDVILALINAVPNVSLSKLEPSEQLAIQKALQAAQEWFAQSGNGEYVDNYAATVSIGDQKVELDYFVPDYASPSERDSSFLLHLKEKAKVEIQHVRRMASF